MAKKSIVLSNGDGRVTFSDTGSLWFDDVNLAITASSVYADSLKLPSIADNKLLQVSGSSLVTVQNGLVNKGTLAWNSTLNQWSASADIVEYYSGSAGGDLTGDYGDSSNPPKVVNISNVNSGTLRALNGGTGLSLASGKNVLLKATSAGITAISASAAFSGSFVTAVSDAGWVLSPPAYYPDVRFYTRNSTQNTFTWTKPANARFVRVILHGAGGGGAGGTVTLGTFRVGTGGSSGGCVDVVYMADSIPSSVLITVGAGGNGGGASINGAAYAGPVNGENTNFGAILTAGGGTASGGTGTTNGGTGVSRTGTNWTSTIAGGISTGGGSAQGSAPFETLFKNGNKNYGYNVDSTGKLINIIMSSGTGINNTYYGNSAYPPYDETLKPAGYGAGGGGGGTPGAICPGFPGGDGYALIISW